jgi:hypothetical protein
MISPTAKALTPYCQEQQQEQPLVFVRGLREKAYHLLPGYFECFPGYPIVRTQYQTYEELAVAPGRRWF